MGEYRPKVFSSMDQVRQGRTKKSRGRYTPTTFIGKHKRFITQLARP